MELGIFWGVAGLMALVVSAILILTLRSKAAGMVGHAEFDRRVYRDQLREIERDMTRGVIRADEAQRLQTEVARRLLEADKAATTEVAAAQGPSAIPIMAGIALLIGASFWGYSILGQPGYPDVPLKDRIEMAEDRRATRPAQATIEAGLPPEPSLQPVDPSFLQLVERLREAVTQRPDDLQGQQLLARNEANLGNFMAAYQAQSQVIALKGAQVTNGDYLLRATLMIQAARGQVSPEAERDLGTVLQRDPNNDTALFFIGVLNMQIGRQDLAFQFWRKLIEVAPPDSPWLPEVRAQIGTLAEVAGVRYQPTPEAAPLGGPSAADVEAARSMTPEERQAMIRTMVEGLNDRLASEGGTPEEWARLISSLASLGEGDRARAIWAEAQLTFATQTEALALIRAAATSAGVVE